MKGKQSKSTNLSFDLYWISFIKTCLSPLIRILIRNKVEFNTFTNICKEIYVSEAETYINETSENCRGKLSSIAYQTGLDRREVSKIKKNTIKKSDYVDQNRSREANILEHWKHMSPFCDDSNKPVPLKRSGKGLSFETLCQRFGKNISHGPILESLLEAKCVKIIDQKVHFINKSYTPSSGVSKEMTQIGATSIKRLISTIHHNFYNQDHPQFQRSIYSVRVKKSLVPKFKQRINEMIRKIYLETITPEFDSIESEFESIESRNDNEPIGLGIFSFHS